MDDTLLESLVGGLLQEGVPHALVARVFDLDPVFVKSYRDQLRVEKYGTDDMQEYLTQLEWDAIDVMNRAVNGKNVPADQVRAASLVIGKTVAVNARRTPEKTAEKRDELLDRMRGMTEDSGPPSEDDSAFAGFVPTNPVDLPH